MGEGDLMQPDPWVRLPELLEWDETTFDAHWEAVRALVSSEDAELLLTSAAAWANAEPSAIQSLGLDVLGELAVTDRARDVLLEVASNLVGHRDEDVRWSLAVALSQAAHDWRATASLLRLLDDPDSDVRYQAVTAIGLSDPDDPRSSEVTAALLRAQHDPSPETRDWATFALGQLRSHDSPAIRSGLLGALDDSDEGTAAEAAVGLAKRRDTRLLPRLMRELVHSRVDPRYVEAAADLGDPALRPLLLALRDEGWGDTPGLRETLEEAISATSSTRS